MKQGRRETPRGTILGPLLVMALIAIAGCGEPGSPREADRDADGTSTVPAHAPGSLRVAAASDLRDALPELARRFQETTGVAVVPVFGASGQLAEQIKAGAPFDVFMAANRAFVEDLAAAGFVQPESEAPYAQGTLVMAVRRESEGVIRGLADLDKAEVRSIALANPATAPYGAAGKQALERAGLWPGVEPKIVQAESVRQALQFVETGNAEAGLVGASIARGSGLRVVAVDPALYDPIVQALGIVTRSRDRRSADAFAAFVLGPEGRTILAGFGFKPPPTVAAP